MTGCYEHGNEMQGNLDLLASQKEFCAMELVIFSIKLAFLVRQKGYINFN